MVFRIKMFFMSFNVKNGDLDLRWQLRHKLLKELEMDHLVFSRRKVLGQMAVSAAGILGLSATNKVFADGFVRTGNSISFFGTQPTPNPSFGQTVLVSGQIFRTDRGRLAQQTVQLWFSGRQGVVRTGTVTVSTDFIGRFNARMTIPRWERLNTWVDVNINCPSIGVLKLFRVRGR
jgi:hypothetical protein